MTLKEAFLIEASKIPLPGSNDVLFHSSPNKKWSKTPHEPVTWFVSSNHTSTHGQDAATEAGVMHDHLKQDGHPDAHVHVFKVKKGIKLGQESDVAHSMKALGREPDMDATWEHMDHRATGDTAGTKALIGHLQSKGFHGIVHRDYSAHHDHDRPSVAVFEPHKVLTRIGSTNEHAKMRDFQDKAKSG